MGHPKWSKEEIKLLKLLYPTASWGQLLRALPRRTPANIRHKASELKVKRVYASPYELNVWCTKCGKYIHRTEIYWKKTAKELTPRCPFCNTELRVGFPRSYRRKVWREKKGSK